MALLEYLGSWEGLEEDWMQFLGDVGDPGPATFDAESDQPADEANAGVP